MLFYSENENGPGPSESSSVSPLSLKRGRNPSGPGICQQDSSQQLSRQNSDSYQSQDCYPTYSPSPSKQSKRKGAENLQQSSSVNRGIGHLLNAESLSNDWKKPIIKEKISPTGHVHHASSTNLKMETHISALQSPTSHYYCKPETDIPSRNPVENSPVDTPTYHRQPVKKPRFVSTENFKTTRNVNQSLPGNGGRQASWGVNTNVISSLHQSAQVKSFFVIFDG